MQNGFNENKYVLRRKVVALGGAKLHIYNEAGQLMFFCKQKAFKLKEDIRLYTDESMTIEALVIRARQVNDFSGFYDVYDVTENVKIGAFQRQGMKSIIQDEWHVLDTQDQQIGLIKEDSTTLALVRRFLSNLVPQNFDLTVKGNRVVDLKQDFNPFVYKLNIDFTSDVNQIMDKRLGVAAGLLIAIIEGRQN